MFADWLTVAAALVLLATFCERLRARRRRRGAALSAPTPESQLLFEEQVRHRAFHDSLTQLPNRALFYDRVQEHSIAMPANRTWSPSCSSTSTPS